MNHDTTTHDQETSVFTGGPLDGTFQQTSPGAICVAVPSHGGCYFFEESSPGGKAIWRWETNPTT